MANVTSRMASGVEALQRLAECAMALCDGQSAGISLLDAEHETFRWPAVVGDWCGYVGGGTPREFGPCGTVLDRGAAQLFTHPERHFEYIAAIKPVIEEALLVPLRIDEAMIGTIWVISHDVERRFDAEDLRALTRLAEFAATAYRHLVELDALDPRTPDDAR